MTFDEYLAKNSHKHNASDLVFSYMQDNFTYAIREKKFLTADDELCCGMAWEDYGNYKTFGINSDETFWWLWNSKNREIVIYVPSSKKFYSVKEQGSWSHLESCDTPRRRALDEEIVPTSEMNEIVKFYIENGDSIWNKAVIAAHENELKSQQTQIESIESILTKEQNHLNDLKLNHKRAFRQIEKSEKTVEALSKRFKSAKATYDRILSEDISQYSRIYF